MFFGRQSLKNRMLWLRSSGVRIALVFTVATVGLLLLVNIIISQRGDQLFWASIPTHKGASTNVQYTGGDHSMPALSSSDSLVSFPQQFHEVLLWVTIAGAIVAVVLGLTLGYILITKPLGRLQHAIGLLKQRDFRSTMPATGLPEFDRVLAEFNGLSKELAQAEELRKNLISDTSHELKTPIQSLLLQVQGMQDGLVPKNKKQFEQLLYQVGKLDILTEQLQEYARLRSRLTHIDLKPHKLLAIVRKSTEGFAAEIDAVGISVVYGIDPHFTVRADRVLLERVFTNLFRNTLAHAQASTITVRAHGNEITFMDNGKGVGQEHVSHLFERFYRIKPRHTPGLGLGLGIVQDAIEAHGWKIWAVSSATAGLEIHILTSSVNV